MIVGSNFRPLIKVLGDIMWSDTQHSLIPTESLHRDLAHSMVGTFRIKKVVWTDKTRSQFTNHRVFKYYIYVNS